MKKRIFSEIADFNSLNEQKQISNPLLLLHIYLQEQRRTRKKIKKNSEDCERKKIFFFMSLEMVNFACLHNQ